MSKTAKQKPPLTDRRPTVHSLKEIMVPGNGYFRSKLVALLCRVFTITESDADKLVGDAIEGGYIESFTVVGLFPGVNVYRLKHKQ